MAIYAYSHVNFAAGFDLSDPKLNWTNPTAAVKNSKNVIIPYLVGMGISFVLIIVFVIPYILISGLLPLAFPERMANAGAVISSIAAAITAWGIIYAIVITMAVIFRRRTVRNLDLWYERMYSN